MVSSMMVYQLMDMSDLNALKNNKFKTVEAKFNLPECLEEIYDMMNLKAQIKNLKLELTPSKRYFPSDVLGDR
jgi:signal transduction histidine kinase